MKKKIAYTFLKIGKYAKNEAEKEVKKMMKHHRIAPAKAKIAVKKIAAHGIKMAKEMHAIAMTEMKKAMKKPIKKKKR